MAARSQSRPPRHVLGKASVSENAQTLIPTIEPVHAHGDIIESRALGSLQQILHMTGCCSSIASHPRDNGEDPRRPRLPDILVGGLEVTITRENVTFEMLLRYRARWFHISCHSAKVKRLSSF
jgi:hypothetical protein